MKNKRKKTDILSVGIIVLFLGLIMFNKNPDKFLNNIMLSPNEPLNIPGEIHFKDIRQLTFSGENAEAYFSSDGKKLIFQEQLLVDKQLKMLQQLSQIETFH